MWKDFLGLAEETRRLRINLLSTKTGMTIKSMEKDWWVTLGLMIYLIYEKSIFDVEFIKAHEKMIFRRITVYEYYV